LDPYRRYHHRDRDGTRSIRALGGRRDLPELLPDGFNPRRRDLALDEQEGRQVNAKQPQLSEIVIANVRKLRRARGFTAQTFAERLTEAGWVIGRVGVTKMEGGNRRSISVDQLAVLGTVLGVEPDQLLGPIQTRTVLVIEAAK
jgi:hypothetical protein